MKMINWKLPAVFSATVLGTLTSSAGAYSFARRTEEVEEECPKYNTEIMLYKDVKLEYGSDYNTLSVRMTSSKQAYLSFGLSETGMMLGADVIVGTADPKAVVKYKLGVEDVGTKLGSIRQTLINATFVQTSTQSVLEFTKLLSDGDDKPIDGYGMNKFIWAQGDDNYLTGHGAARGVLDIALYPCRPGSIKIEKPIDKTLFAIHGILAVIAFAVFMPLAITAASARNLLGFDLLNKKAWYVIHSSLNALANFLSLVFFVLALYAANVKNGRHFHDTHGIIGLITVILLVFQVAFAFFRPATPQKVPAKQLVDDDEEKKESDVTPEEKTDDVKIVKSPIRAIWEVSHRVLGVVILALGYYQIHSGLHLYNRIYGGPNHIPAFWISMGSLSLVLFATIVYSKRI